MDDISPMDNELEEVIKSLIGNLRKEYKQQQQKFHSIILWQALVLDGKFHLFQKLHNAENHFAGYNTIIVPIEGFSENDNVHNMVLD